MLIRALSTLTALALAPTIGSAMPTFEDGASLTVAGMGNEIQPVIAGIPASGTEPSMWAPTLLAVFFVAVLYVSYRARTRTRHR